MRWNLMRNSGYKRRRAAVGLAQPAAFPPLRLRSPCALVRHRSTFAAAERQRQPRSPWVSGCTGALALALAARGSLQFSPSYLQRGQPFRGTALLRPVAYQASRACESHRQNAETHRPTRLAWSAVPVRCPGAASADRSSCTSACSSSACSCSTRCGRPRRVQRRVPIG